MLQQQRQHNLQRLHEDVASSPLPMAVQHDIRLLLASQRGFAPPPPTQHLRGAPPAEATNARKDVEEIAAKAMSACNVVSCEVLHRNKFAVSRLIDVEVAEPAPTNVRNHSRTASGKNAAECNGHTVGQWGEEEEQKRISHGPVRVHTCDDNNGAALLPQRVLEMLGDPDFEHGKNTQATGTGTAGRGDLSSITIPTVARYTGATVDTVHQAATRKTTPSMSGPAGSRTVLAEAMELTREQWREFVLKQFRAAATTHWKSVTDGNGGIRIPEFSSLALGVSPLSFQTASDGSGVGSQAASGGSDDPYRAMIAALVGTNNGSSTPVVVNRPAIQLFNSSDVYDLLVLLLSSNTTAFFKKAVRRGVGSGDGGSGNGTTGAQAAATFLHKAAPLSSFPVPLMDHFSLNSLVREYEGRGYDMRAVLNFLVATSKGGDCNSCSGRRPGAATVSSIAAVNIVDVLRARFWELTVLDGAHLSFSTDGAIQAENDTVYAKRYKEGIHLIKATGADADALRRFARFGIPTALRGMFYSVMLGLPIDGPYAYAGNYSSGGADASASCRRSPLRCKPNAEAQQQQQALQPQHVIVESNPTSSGEVGGVLTGIVDPLPTAQYAHFAYLRKKFVSVLKTARSVAASRHNRTPLQPLLQYHSTYSEAQAHQNPQRLTPMPRRLRLQQQQQQQSSSPTKKLASSHEAIEARCPLLSLLVALSEAAVVYFSRAKEQQQQQCGGGTQQQPDDDRVMPRERDEAVALHAAATEALDSIEKHLALNVCLRLAEDDVRLVTDEDAYFMFEDAIVPLARALVLDATTHTPLGSNASAAGDDESSSLRNWLPFQRSTFLVGPMCYVFSGYCVQRAHIAARAMFERYYCNLCSERGLLPPIAGAGYINCSAGDEGTACNCALYSSLPYLCVLFEDLGTLLFPHVQFHCAVRLQYPLLKIVLPWLMLGFTAQLNPIQHALLYDRILGFDTSDSCCCCCSRDASTRGIESQRQRQGQALTHSSREREGQQQRVIASDDRMKGDNVTAVVRAIQRIHSLSLLSVLAAGVCLQRSTMIMQCRTSNELELVMLDVKGIEVIPLMHSVLCAA